MQISPHFLFNVINQCSFGAVPDWITTRYLKVEIDFINHFSELVHKLLDNSFNSYSLNDENILSKDNKDLLLLW